MQNYCFMMTTTNDVLLFIVFAVFCLWLQGSGDSASQWRFRVGSTFASSGGVVHTLSTYINHPNFNWGTANNDFCIMRSVNTIAYNDVVQPVAIAGANYNLADNQVVWAAGWGDVAVGGPSSETLRHVQIWTVNQAVCAQRYATRGYTITAQMLCSGWLDVGGRDQCQGDSGGPLYHNGVVVGVCSWGLECADAFFPGINARVSAASAWIQANA